MQELSERAAKRQGNEDNQQLFADVPPTTAHVCDRKSQSDKHGNHAEQTFECVLEPGGGFTPVDQSNGATRNNGSGVEEGTDHAKSWREAGRLPFLFQHLL